jgi:hypothetical protein
MKTPPWLELSLTAAALLVGMLLAMWVQRPEPGCTLSLEAPRRLVLSRETDREHLAAEVALADRIARRYVRSNVNLDQQRARLAGCEATLVRQIATRYGLSPDEVRASPADGR